MRLLKTILEDQSLNQIILNLLEMKIHQFVKENMYMHEHLSFQFTSII